MDSTGTGAHSAFDYVIVGAGVAAASAATAIRAHDADGTLAILGREPDGPYYRPDLSKTLWLDDTAQLDDGWLLDGEAGAELRTGASVTAIDTTAQTLTLADTSTIGYGHLLLATGSQPRELDLPASDRIVYLRTVEDYRHLRDRAKPGSRAVVVGGGYIGAEIASALAQNDVAVTMLMRGAAVQGHMFPARLADAVTQTYRDRGVTVVGESTAYGVSDHDDHLIVADAAGDTHTAEVVVVGVGVAPNDQVARQAGITVDDGIIVDRRLATNAPHVWAAGDVARYEDALLGDRRVEHVDNAEHMGAVAGRNMAVARTRTGDAESYTYTPIFWSDLFDHGYEAVGELDAALETVEDFTDDGGAGVVYYLDAGQVRGVLLWNVWDSTDTAKQVIEQSTAEPLDAAELQGRISLG
ncbi:NAD(P)/FAD-dependent oxidoreductase [Brevibacterium jeotgali]|uniref:Pyridine nucleotide-disulphide oxidoreductase n=1 Tax=Brevibacterium jeotgali TaxID=1262550 RepID=A0A2H1L2R9_9MICO|nr:FAD/NAD(P)-binding oxidoreductase [Brevibacterium jeotgali]TWC02400.1 pyridine nucleotide-disulfide oxidoreductase [Brevibacterium jeotgali]SMY11192.1 Pyridine nucleotide-disulphide oxidoreductase [Brevibacterium jeotgali]